MNESNIARRRNASKVLLLGGVFVLVAGGIAFLYYDIPFPNYIGVLVPAAILIMSGYRGVTSTKALETREYERAGLEAFWSLMAVIIVIGSLDLVSVSNPSLLYVTCGVILFGAFTVYYKFIRGPKECCREISGN